MEISHGGRVAGSPGNVEGEETKVRRLGSGRRRGGRRGWKRGGRGEG